MSRPVGSKNIRKLQQQEHLDNLMAKYGDPMDFLFRVVFQKGEFKNNAEVDVQMRVACALRISEYAYSKRRAIEVAVGGNEPIQMSWLADDDPRLLEANGAGLLEGEIVSQGMVIAHEQPSQSRQ